MGELDRVAGEARLRWLKGGGEDIAHVPAEAVEVLRSHLGGRAGGPVFGIGPGLGHRRLAQRGTRAGIGPVSPHQLRHTFRMAAYWRTGDVLVTAGALCHRSVASTAVYARPAPAAVRAAIG